MAFLVMLDSMTPAERVAFVLHDVFRYSFAEVAGIVGRTPAACRQLDPDATATADGGGRATTFRDPIRGGVQIARAWIELARRAPAAMTFLERTVNGQPALISRWRLVWGRCRAGCRACSAGRTRTGRRGRAR
jgi:hypothetical protein